MSSTRESSSEIIPWRKRAARVVDMPAPVEPQTRISPLAFAMSSVSDGDRWSSARDGMDRGRARIAAASGGSRGVFLVHAMSAPVGGLASR